MQSDRILILAGTAEARALANEFVDLDVDVVSSFAGVTEKPILPQGKIRVGNFGGVAGLQQYLQSERITHVIDATHPFAAQMSLHAVEAAKLMQVKLLRLERPAWVEEDGETWSHVPTIEAAAELLPENARVLLTTGRKGLQCFFDRKTIGGVIRSIETPAETLPPGWTHLQDRPPYSVTNEARLLSNGSFSHVVTKNAGGSATSAKLTAAFQAGVLVVMVDRPLKPECETVQNLEDAIGWVFSE